MSNWKHAYGWSGHILVSSDEMDSEPEHNLVAIPDQTFKALVLAHSNLRLDQRIQSRQLGIESTGEIVFLATGSCFSKGFKCYGTVFTEAEVRAAPRPALIDRDAEYMRAMKEIYGIELPPCRLMIGCASEH